MNDVQQKKLLLLLLLLLRSLLLPRLLLLLLLLLWLFLLLHSLGSWLGLRVSRRFLLGARSLSRSTGSLGPGDIGRAASSQHLPLQRLHLCRQLADAQLVLGVGLRTGTGCLLLLLLQLGLELLVLLLGLVPCSCKRTRLLGKLQSTKWK